MPDDKLNTTAAFQLELGLSRLYLSEMHELTDNNGYLVARGSKARLLRYVERQRRFDASCALWIDGVRVL